MPHIGSDHVGDVYWLVDLYAAPPWAFPGKRHLVKAKSTYYHQRSKRMLQDTQDGVLVPLMSAEAGGVIVVVITQDSPE
jgi:hypothetical protein